jgi:3-isopropylmalate/(R)-2-methylmalate dehydratase small subunit
MTPLTIVESRAIPLALANVDTDQLIPARFMKRPRSEGYGPSLLHDLRADPGSEATRLDDPVFANAQILVVRRNFGSGSSREAAVYALADYGFRCILAPSFGDIFASNAVKNGVLPAIISEANAETLLNDSTLRSGGLVHIDLAQQIVRVGNHVLKFEIEPVWKTQLLNGWDDIDMTRSYSAAIADFIVHDAQARPWARPCLG